MYQVQPVILCGGNGLRLWPASRQEQPKQLLNLIDGQSGLDEAVQRVMAMDKALPPLLVCSEVIEQMIVDHLADLGIDEYTLLVEPVARDTAAAVYVASKWVAEHQQDAVMVICPADHHIKDVVGFNHSLTKAVECAALGGVVCIGIQPDHAATGYGYIKKGAAKPLSIEIAEFKEKPDVTQAQAFVDSGDYLWNAGVFVANAEVLINEYIQHAIEMTTMGDVAYRKIIANGALLYLPAKEYAQCLAKPFDIAIMEKTSRAQVVPYAGQWDDVGNWHSVWQCSSKDAHGNVVKGTVYEASNRNSLIWAKTKPVVAIGIQDTIVVDTEDATLVVNKDYVQQVKGMAQMMREDGLHQVHEVRESNRPWGTYKVLENTPGIKIKQLFVKPGGKLSLQRHQQRSENWMIASGKALVTCDDFKGFLTAGESISIPQGAVHRLENPGIEPVVVIEVQMGAYLGEDDIERIEDIYQRRCS